MVDKKITELTNITGVNLATTDEFIVVDVSVDETKAITFGELSGRFTTDINDAVVSAQTAQTGAEVAQAGAEAAEANTILIFDQFGDQYLGPKASDPTLDNDGDPLAIGAIYYNTVEAVLKFYTGTVWTEPDEVATTAAAAALASEQAAATSETNAATSEANAATSEANALTYSSNSAASAVTAGLEADAAAASSSSAQLAETNAAATAAALTGFDLEAIAASKAVTAVDVFVYDTSKDSDGGAWRKRTQGTSWYQETLNTATRGSRREFPAVAVIVAEAAKVTIYDGDDPALPMWMVFTAASPSMVRTTVTAVTALQGALCVSSTGGLSRIEFNEDDGVLYLNGGYTASTNGMLGLIDRNSSFGWTAKNAALALVNNAVNDVAMTVLPDAPIDPATGLPVPTIAVATDGGVSVIKDDGTVWSPNLGTYAQAKLAFNEDWSVISVGRSAGPIAKVGLRHDQFAFETKIGNNWQYVLKIDIRNETASSLLADSGNATSNIPDFIYASPSLSRLDLVRETPASSMIARVTSSYNTGWMNGNIKGAFLSDTDTTSLVGSGELVTNGTFDTDLTGWSASISLPPASFVWDAGAMTVTGDGVGAKGVNHAVTCVVGKRYAVSADITGTGYITSSSNQSGWSPTSNITSFVATYTTMYIVAAVSGSNVATFDNISVKLADEDRSVNNKGLIVNGAITRTPVATGADLVAYSGFSASNYLEQPYNSDLDFGTGDFCVMGWVNVASANNDQFIKRIDSTNSGNGFMIVTDGGGEVSFYRIISGSNARLWEGSDISGDGWLFIAASRSSGLLSFYENGSLVHTSADTTDYTNTSANLYIGVNEAKTFSCSGSLALLRISATAPTAEQVAKIYNDEKPLFQENAQATLYGTSDAVTALAHDDATDLLHVGTSAGRSVFQGLRRVSNTTTAVGTAISASNGLVVEE